MSCEHEVYRTFGLYSLICACGVPQQGLGGSWQDSAPEELRIKLGMAVRQLKGNWRIGDVLKLIAELYCSMP